MSAWVDISFLRQLASRLDRYKEKRFSPYLANCRCVLCGDSEKKTKKARGYFFQHDNTIFYKCHNCQASSSFGKFLKEFDKNLYDRYILEKFRDKIEVRHDEPPRLEQPATKSYVPDVTVGLKSIDELNSTHPAVLYVKKRRIPEEHWDNIFYVPKFFKWTRGHTDKFSYVEGGKDHARLIFPWYDHDGQIFAYHARTMGKEDPKYYSIVISDKVKEKAFGLERLDNSKRIYVVEGPIDSLYLPNAVAVGTSALYIFSRTSDHDVVYIPDRDIRNPEIMKIVKKMIDSGKKVCMLPDNLPGKDIGEFVENNLSAAQIVDIIDSNTYQGLEAQLRFTVWRKYDTTEGNLRGSKIQRRNYKGDR